MSMGTTIDAASVVAGARVAFAIAVLGAVRVGGAATRARVPSSGDDVAAGGLVGRGVVLPLTCTVVLLVAARLGPTIGLGLALAAWLVPRRVRAAAQERTGRSFDRELPSLLDAWARHVRGGLAPAVALVDATAGSGASVQRAMAPVMGALQRGASLEEAVAQRWPDRSGPARPLVTAAVAIAQPLGGVRAQGLDVIAATVREHAGLEAEKQVQAAQARVSAVVMTVAPLLFCAFLVLRDGDASAFLLRSPVGVACGVVGIGLDLLAGTWMRAAVRRAG